jgi:putative SOS response-associated peptidase YedK
MCGRFALKNPTKELKQYYNTQNEVEYAARYNIAPTTAVITIHATPDGSRIMEPMRWGLVPSWAKDVSIGNRMINARSDTVDKKPSYRAAFMRRRCVIPASGFYEWHTETREPYYFSPKEGFLSLAGLWEHWQSPDGSELHTCTIITTDANALVQPIHERMPVILKGDALNLWLDNTQDVTLLKPLLTAYDETKLNAWPISKRVNSPANDSPELMKAV